MKKVMFVEVDKKTEKRINDLKTLLSTNKDDYDSIISIFKRNANSMEEAKNYIVRYLPKFIKDIDGKNSLLIMNHQLNVYRCYLLYHQELTKTEENNVEEFINNLNSMDDFKLIKYINTLGYEKDKEKLDFFIKVHHALEKCEKGNKEKLIIRIKEYEKKYYNKLLKVGKRIDLGDLRRHGDKYYNFVLELIKTQKELWPNKITEFMNSQIDELKAKNKILKIILFSKFDSEMKEKIKAYKLFEKLIELSITYIDDPITKVPIAKGTFKSRYTKEIKFLEELMKLSLEEEKEIIDLFAKLLKDKTQNMANDILKKLRQLFAYLYPDISLNDLDKYIMVYQQYRENLQEKAYDNHKKNQRDRIEKRKEISLNEKLIDAREFINKYLNGNYYIIEEYKNEYNIKSEEFKENLSILQKYDQELYSRFEEKQTKGMLVINEKINLLLEYLKNGIGEEKREFDVIDYYEIIGIDLLLLREIILSSTAISPKDQYTLVKFLGSNYAKEPLGPNVILKTYLELGCEYDDEGNPLKGTGQIVPLEVREKVVEILKNSNIPLNNITFKQMLMRLLEEEQKVIIPRKK